MECILADILNNSAFSTHKEATARHDLNIKKSHISLKNHKSFQQKNEAHGFMPEESKSHYAELENYWKAHSSKHIHE